MAKIKSMMDAVIQHNKMLQYLRENYPANLQKDREDGAEYVWQLSRGNDPFHADGLGKTQHNEEVDE